MSDRLLDVAPSEIEHYRTGRDLVPVMFDRCPRCGGELELRLLRQDTLFRGGGYGGTQRVETWACTCCSFARVVGVATERPPRAVATAVG